MAMAPTQNSREAVTKPSVKRLPPSPLTSLERSSSPAPSKRRSMSMALPRMLPMTMHTMTHSMSAVPVR